MRDSTRSRTASIGPIEAVVEAPAELVFEMLSAIGTPNRLRGERSAIVERHDGVLVCDFWTLVPIPVVGERLIRTREEVRLEPPDAVHYRHLDGPLLDLRETITVEPVAPRRTLLRYEATYRPRTVLHRVGIRLARPLIERTMVQHFADLRGRAEARAARSRKFPPAPETVTAPG